jgi:molybdopterin converting factor small subunit
MNVSSLIPSGINNTLASTGLPSAFGDQIARAATQKVISAALGQLQILKQKLEEIIKRKLELEITHKNNLQRLDAQYIPGKPEKSVLTEEEYNIAVAAENIRYETEKATLNEEQKQTEGQIQSITKDPKAKRKAEQKIAKAKRKKNKAKNKAEKTKAAKAILLSTSKSVAPLLMYAGVRVAARLAVQNSSLKDLVDQTNIIIAAANTPEQLEQARVSRNAAYNVINNNERNLINIKEKLEIIALLVTILTALSAVLIVSLSFPGTPASAYKPYEVIAKTLGILSAILLALIPILDVLISELSDLKAQLREIDNKLDLETIDSGNLAALSALLDSIKQPKDEIYKGFRLVVKEDQDPKTFVKGSIKRHYAAALDRDGVEVIKSEYSYTLDPQVLIDQLKIIIDQQNLQA